MNVFASKAPICRVNYGMVYKVPSAQIILLICYNYRLVFLPPISYLLHCMVLIFIILARVIIVARVFRMECNGIFVSYFFATCNCNDRCNVVMVWGKGNCF